MFDLPCVIFAGGKSSRMGQDKSLLPFGGYDTLVQYQYERLKHLFKDVCISAKSADKLTFDAPVIEDPAGCNVFAPTAGFVSLFQTLKDARVFVLSVDTPFVTKTEIRALVEADTDDTDAVIARTASGSHPMCGIYHRSLLPDFESMLREENHRLGMLLKKSRTRFVDFDDECPFMNLNHPHEYEKACLSLAKKV